MPSRFVLPLPSFVMRPYAAVIIALVHLYLGVGHLGKLFGGDVEWTHFWKGFGALVVAYVFLALASRGLASQEGRHIHAGTAWPRRRGMAEQSSH